MNDSVASATQSSMDSIGKRIRRVREGVPRRTQAEFADLLGVSRGAVGNWERGLGIARENISMIANKTGVELGWLMRGPDDGPIPFRESGEEIITQVASEPTLATEEAAALISWIIQALGQGDEAEARILARAVLRAYRTPSVPPQSVLSEDQRRLLVFEAVRLFRS